MNRITLNTLFLLLSSALSQSLLADNQDNEKQTPKKIETYQAAVPINRASARYPNKMLRDARGGWVDFNFMVNGSGETYEIEATDHSYGGEDFIKAATRAVEKYTYNPAKLDGNSVDSSNSIRLRFEMKRPTLGVSRNFHRRYKAFYKAMDNKDQINAKKMLGELANSKRMSLYDDAYLNAVNYHYEKEFGTPEGQRIYLERAVSDPGQKRYFKNDQYIALVANLFVLQATQHYFGEALNTYRNLANQKNAFDLTTKLEGTVNDIETIYADNSTYQVKGAIDKTTNWTIDLFKPSFEFTNVVGQIDEIKLRCSKKYVFFKFEEGNNYNVPESYGGCYLSVIGSPSTTFNLHQFARTEQ